MGYTYDQVGIGDRVMDACQAEALPSSLVGVMRPHREHGIAA